MNKPHAETSDQIIQRHDAYLINCYPRYPATMVRGEGCYLYDNQGARYLDLFAGFGAGLLGHCHPDVVAAITAQAQTLLHPGNLFHTEPQTLVAEAIARHGFSGRSFFCHSGADANEAALKLARLYGKAKPGSQDPASGGRFKVICTYQSFHGRTFGTMPATGQSTVARRFEPHLPGFVHVPYNDAEAVADRIDDQTVAVMVEPLQGEGGVIVPDDAYLPALRSLCDRHDLLLICDEVWTGCGRTGQWFGHQHWNIEPDIMTLAKGVGGGLPVGVMCARGQLADYFDCALQDGVVHASTLGGNCASMAASAAVLAVIERDGLIDHARKMGQYARDRMAKALLDCKNIKSIRGLGLFIGIELNQPAKPVVEQCMAAGILVNAAQKSIIRLAPPLVVNKNQLDAGLDVLETLINKL